MEDAYFCLPVAGRRLSEGCASAAGPLWRLGGSGKPLGRSWGGLEAVLRRSWALLGSLGEVLGGLGMVSGGLEAVLGGLGRKGLFFAGFMRVWDIPAREDTTPGGGNMWRFGAWGKPTGRGNMTTEAWDPSQVDRNLDQ